MAAVLVVPWLVLSASRPARSQAIYTASGGLIDGTLGTTPFSQATWTVSAVGDPALVQLGAVLGVNPMRFLPVQPTLELRQAGSTLLAQLQPTAPFSWTVYSLDLSRARPGLSVNGFALIDSRDPAAIPDGFPDALAVAVASDGFNALIPTLLLQGRNDTRSNAVSTDQGPLTISFNSRGPGSFRITAAPGPLPLAALGVTFAWSRRLRRRLRRR